MKAFGYYILAIIFRITIFLANLLPERVVYSFFNKLSSLFMRSSRRYRRRIKKNLKIAFGPSCDNQYIENITRNLTKNIGLSCAETILSGTKHKNNLLKRISVHGTENLDNALSHEKGVIAVSAHLGNFTLIGVKMLREGYPFTTLVKESKRQGIAKGIRKIQKGQDGRFIYMDPWSKAVRQILYSLKKNEIVCLIADEKRKHTGINVRFFGEPALTATGPAILSLRTGAPILPIFIVRNEDHSHHIFIEPQLEYNLNSNTTEDIYTITTAYTIVIEKYIRMYPDQWFWINNRWKKKKRKHLKTNT
ncbi:MAG: lysophospholipid acyltransferase family protein [Deltaproteobacteria bacterium]|nr:lysophospholipid acyltransferase family protein [Deltaproteobacteria bacterium]